MGLRYAAVSLTPAVPASHSYTLQFAAPRSLATSSDAVKIIPAPPPAPIPFAIRRCTPPPPLPTPPTPL